MLFTTSLRTNRTAAVAAVSREYCDPDTPTPGKMARSRRQSGKRSETHVYRSLIHLTATGGSTSFPSLVIEK